jgi:hypothetical protein
VRSLLDSSEKVLEAASDTGIMLETLSYGKEKPARELLWRGNWLGPRLRELQENIAGMSRHVGLRAEATFTLALRKLCSEREAICRSILTVQKLHLPEAILDEIISSTYAHMLRCQSLQDFRRDITRIRHSVNK